MGSKLTLPISKSLGDWYPNGTGMGKRTNTYINFKYLGKVAKQIYTAS